MKKSPPFICRTPRASRHGYGATFQTSGTKTLAKPEKNYFFHQPWRSFRNSSLHPGIQPAIRCPLILKRTYSQLIYSLGQYSDIKISWEVHGTQALSPSPIQPTKSSEKTTKIVSHTFAFCNIFICSTVRYVQASPKSSIKLREHLAKNYFQILVI